MPRHTYPPVRRRRAGSCKKKRYGDAQQAHEALAAMRGSGEIRVQQCDICSSWHTTSTGDTPARR